MKVTSLYLRDFRSFRGEITLDFREPLTGQARPITLLAGSNGSGKTTILEIIRDLLSLVITTDPKPPLLREAQAGSMLCLRLEIEPELSHIDDPRPLHIAVGRNGLQPEDYEERWPNLVCDLARSNDSGTVLQRHSLADHLQGAFEGMQSGDAPFRGGVLYFPHLRQLYAEAPVTVAPPPEVRGWTETVHAVPASASELEQLLVWQNYLDLEEHTKNQRNLRPFIERIEPVLGRERRIKIERGRVYVRQPRPNDSWVRLEQLPSGEKQIVLLLGELARRSRPGMVCLIDEPEISLHPALQQSLVGSLRDYARREEAQFILATHSQEIVSALPRATLFLDHMSGVSTRPKALAA